MKIGKSITHKQIAKELNLLKEHGDEAIYIAGLIKKLAISNTDEFDKIVNNCRLIHRKEIRHSLHESKMQVFNQLLLGHGVEAIFQPGEYYTPILEYVNMGDTYNTTILSHKNEYHIGNWGSWVEYLEKQGYEIE